MNNVGESLQKELIQMAVRLDRRLYGKPEPPSPSLGIQNYLRFFLNLIGFFLGFFFLRLTPPAVSNRLSSFVSLFKSSRKVSNFSQENQSALEESRALIHRCRKNFGLNPCVLILTTHPKTSTSESHLLGEMFRCAVQITDRVSPCSKIKLVQAIDSFALDTIPLVAGDIYSGLMRASHLAMDRLPTERTTFQKLLFQRSHYRRTLFEIVKALKQKHVVCIALGGAVVHNARLLYSAKEFAQKIHRLSLTQPHSRTSHRHSRESGNPERDVSRIVLIRQVTSLLSGEKATGCTQGILSQDEKKGLVSILSRMGLSQESLQKEIHDFENELRLETPYRLRFFRVLLGRICGRKTPLILLPLSHFNAGQIVLNAAELVLSFDSKTEKIIRLNKEGAEETEPLTEFVQRFVSAKLNPR
ncbi:MAG: hypothetical protein HY610_03040 [Elusimicrobia bacterium]|nr:hypothetical protein [Elusimicrobiota bacterium]